MIVQNLQQGLFSKDFAHFLDKAEMQRLIEFPHELIWRL